jgi:hypothetical protein
LNAGSQNTDERLSPGEQAPVFHLGILAHTAETGLEAAMQKFLALLGLLALALTGGIATVSTLISPP